MQASFVFSCCCMGDALARPVSHWVRLWTMSLFKSLGSGPQHPDAGAGASSDTAAPKVRELPRYGTRIQPRTFPFVWPGPCQHRSQNSGLMCTDATRDTPPPPGAAPNGPIPPPKKKPHPMWSRPNQSYSHRQSNMHENNGWHLLHV